MRRDSELYLRARERVDAVWSSSEPETIGPNKTEYLASLEGFAPCRQRPKLASQRSEDAPPAKAGSDVRPG